MSLISAKQLLLLDHPSSEDMRRKNVVVVNDIDSLSMSNLKISTGEKQFTLTPSDSRTQLKKSSGGVGMLSSYERQNRM